MKAELPDFVALKMRYDNESFPTGARAELRRVGEPDDAAFTPALYRLFPGQRPDERHLRLAYLSPIAGTRPRPNHLGRNWPRPK